MSQPDRFHEIAQMIGYTGRLDLSSLDPPARAKGYENAIFLAEGYINAQVKHLPRMLPVHFGIFDSWTFNAFACLDQGEYFIGISRGVIATIGLVFDRMLADPAVMPSLEGQTEPGGLPLFPNIGPDFIQTITESAEFPRPRSPYRLAVAQHLMRIAFNFVLAHEFAHIANGHIDHASLHRIAEVSEVTSREGGIVSQVCEMDADASAVRLTFYDQWRRYFSPQKNDDPMYQNPERIHLFWSVAVSTICRLFGNVRLNDSDMVNNDYPPWPLRSMMIQRAVIRLMGTGGEGGKADADQNPFDGKPTILDEGQDEVERAFSVLTGRPIEREGLDEAKGPVGREHAKRLREYWRSTLRAELLPLTYWQLSDFSE